MKIPQRNFDFICYQQEHAPREKAFSYQPPNSTSWKSFSTDEMIDMMNATSRGLIRAGIQAGDRIALVSYKNRPEWLVVDWAVQQIGAVSVPVYPTISAREYEYIFKDASVVMAFCGSGDLTEKVGQAARKTPSLRSIFAFDPSETPHWTTLWSEEGQSEVESRSQEVKPEQLATLIYTSGTTGNPKGVMLSHRNMVSNVLDVQEIIPIQPGDRVLSFLPLCHSFERTASLSYTYNSAEVYFTGTDNLGGENGDLQTVKPHFFTTVPRLLEKVYEKIYAKGLELSGLKRALFFWALRLTEDYEYGKTHTGIAALKRKLADQLIYSKWRQALGGEVRGILTGAAACPVNIARTFSAAGIPIREGYGLTESSPGLTMSGFEADQALLGTVGTALRQVEIRIDPMGDMYGPGEGEILATGPNIMMGYYNKPEATAKVIEERDGKRWLRTGDVGKLIPGPKGKHFLKITDRKKELLKTSGGKYVAPTPIESALKENFLIEHAMIVGENRKFVSALIVPAWDTLKNWAADKEISWNQAEELLTHPRVLQRFQRIIDKINPNFNHVEQIKKFALLKGPWETIKSDGSEAELTPTLKLKRRIILKKYARQIKNMY